MIRSTIALLLGFLATVAQQPKTPLAPTARIEGTAVDGLTERPIAGVTVTALQADETRTAETDAQGHFLFPVRHGTVRLLARKDSYIENRDGILITATPGQQLRGITMRLVAGGSVSGSVYDARRKPVPYAHAVLMRNTYDEDGERGLRPVRNGQGGMTNEHGEFHITGAEPGDYLLQIDPPTLGEREPGEPFVTGYYPDTPYVTRAQLITVKSGSDARLDDLTLPSVRGGTIRVHLVNQTGGRVDNTMSKYIRWNAAGSEAQMAVIPLLYMGGPERAEIPVSPGTYDVTAGWLRGTNPALPPIGVGQKRVDVGRGNVDVEIVVQKGMRLTGRVVQESSSRGGPKPVGGVRCEIQSDKWARMSATSSADGSITMDNVQAATYRFGCFSLPPETYISKVLQGDRDVLKMGLDVQTETNVVVMIAGDGGTVEGSVTDAKGQKVADAVVALVPDAPLSEARHLFKSVKTDQVGGFTVRAVAPGAYHLFAWTSLEGAAYKNVEFMKQFEPQGFPLKVTPAAKLTAPLRLLEQ